MTRAERAAAGIVAGGLALRVAVAAALAGRPLADDAADYHAMAVQLAGGAPFEPDWPPGLPGYLVPFHALLGATPLADRVAMLLLYLAFSWLLFGLARRVAGERAGVVAVAAFAVFPSYVYLSVTPLTQLPAATLLVAAAWATLALVDAPGWRRAALVGLALGALLLVRPSNLLLCAAAPPLLFLATRRLSSLVAPALVIAVLLGAWTVRAHDLTGRWILVNNANSQNLFYGNNPWTPRYRTWWFGSHKRGEPGVPDGFVAEHARLAAAPPSERDRAFSRSAVAHIKAEPGLFARRSFARVRTFFAFDTFTGAQLAARTDSRAKKLAGLAVTAADAACYLAVAALALMWLLAPGDRRAAWVIGLGVLLYAVPYFVTFAHPTYHFPVVPLLGVAAAARLTAAPAPARPGPLYWVAAAAFALVQVEWAIDLSSRM